MATPRRIAVLTGSRAEYGLLYWTIRSIHEDPDLELLLLVTGMHLSPEFGMTVDDIERDGFPIAARIESLLSSDSGEGVATSMGLETVKLAQTLAQIKPDIMLLLGDRSEVLAAATAALPQLIPLAHIHGGESSEGAIDESIRHAVTKMSHLHFPSTEFYAQRLLQMGEEEWRVHVCGAPALEHLHRRDPMTRQEVERETGLDLDRPTLVATQHPATVLSKNGDSDVEQVLAALEDSGLQTVITYPNSDAGGRAIIEQIRALEARCPNVHVRVSLGARPYLGLLGNASAMVGNSSSGIIEAASLGLPVINVGDRQKGRLRGANVIDVPAEKNAILEGIRQAVEPSFKDSLSGMQNPYDRGNSSEIIISVIKDVPLDRSLIQKRFSDSASTVACLRPAERL